MFYNPPQADGVKLPCCSFDFDVYACGEAQLIERLDRFARCLDNINETLVCADLELVTCLLVDMRPRKNRVPLDASRQRDRPMHERISTLGRVYYLGSTLVQHRVVVGLHPNSYDFLRSSHL